MSRKPTYDKAMKKVHVRLPLDVLRDARILAVSTDGTLQGTLRELILDGAKHRLDALKTEPR